MMFFKPKHCWRPKPLFRTTAIDSKFIKISQPWYDINLKHAYYPILSASLRLDVISETDIQTSMQSMKSCTKHLLNLRAYFQIHALVLCKSLTIFWLVFLEMDFFFPVNSVLVRIHTILLRQPSRLSQELFGKLLSMICVGRGLYRGMFKIIPVHVSWRTITFFFNIDVHKWKRIWKHRMAPFSFLEFA